MRTARIESLLRELKIPIPPGIKAAIENRDKGPGAAEVERRIRERLAKGGAGDTFDLASSQVPRKLQDDLVRLVEVAVMASAPALVPVVHESRAQVIAQARQLGELPATAEQAMDAGPAGVKAYQALKALAGRHERLCQLHHYLIDDDLIPTLSPTAFELHGQSQARPVLSGGRWISPVPTDSAEALIWLTLPGSQPWTPTKIELHEHYFQTLSDMQAPKEPVTTASVTA